MKPRSRGTVYLAASRVATRLTAHVDPLCSGLARASDETAVVAASGSRRGDSYQVTFRGENARAAACQMCGESDLSTDWMDFAACVGLFDLFFDTAKRSEAKEICRTCPVVDPCLEYGSAIKAPAGVWGGEVFSEHSRPRKRRKKVVA